MSWSPSLFIHVVGGILGVLSGAVALLVRKGSPLHRAAGKVFVISMLFMAAFGVYLAFVKSQQMNVLGGVFAFYMVATAWLTVKRKEGETGLLEIGLLLIVLADGIALFLAGWRVRGGTGAKGGEGAVMAFIFASLAFLCGGSDIRMLVRGGVSGAKRIVRHVWRMGFALFTAVGSFFLGTASDPVLRRTGLRATLFTKAVRATHLPELPVLIVVVLTIYWVCRVMFTKEYRSRRNLSSLNIKEETPCANISRAF